MNSENRQSMTREEYERREARRLKRRQERIRRQKRERLVRLLIMVVIPVAVIIVASVLVINAIVGAVGNKKPGEKTSEVVAVESEPDDKPEKKKDKYKGPYLIAIAPVEFEILEPEPEFPEGSHGATSDIPLFAHSAESTDATKGFNDEMTSGYGILIDTTTGEIVASRSGKDRMVPASMTKVLTVLTAYRHITDDQLDEMIEISAQAGDYAYRNDCSIVGFSTGEKVAVRDLFYGTILPSGGDAAYALAEYVAGDMDTFVDMMNETVKELGLEQTSHFTNPVGIYDDNLYTTPYDMAMIMWAAEDYAFLHDVLETHIYTTTKTEEHPDGITVSNWFLRRIEDKDCGLYVAGGKTGFVVQSGNCAVSYAEAEDGHNYICCTGSAHSSWRAIYDHVAAYNQR